jgi:hypothetical protein
MLSQYFVSLLQLLQVSVLVSVTGGAGVGNRWIFDSFNGQQGDEGMAANVTNFSAFGNSGHVATHTITK